ncbi:UNVERIFIED_CONTAM: putative late blight resistance proteinR1A-10 [Sesamum latifolium]|uniref:Late blight resistance proteinR1A-10 n=1 Tax=Sesamum latifolium TaxID=2727402 RepID=A0AAW2UK54_9LAMI
MALEYWEFIAENVNSFANSEDDNYCSNILSLSYNNLPIHLKPCFLYMRAFPEDDEINVSELIRLWVAEGFLKPIRGKSLENVADEYLKDLIDRNMILIRKRKISRKIKTCSIHDLLRDLCLKEFEKEHFIYVPKMQRVDFFPPFSEMCFMCGRLSEIEIIDLPGVHVAPKSPSLATLLVCHACRNMYPDFSRARLVRLKYTYSKSYKEFLLFTRLGYLNVQCKLDLGLTSPSTIPLLWNLKVLTLASSYNMDAKVLPSEIWEMPQLRHVIVRYAILPDPLVAQNHVILENLQTLSNIENLRFTDEILERIPNVKKLEISYCRGDPKPNVVWSYYCLHNLVHLHKLESLSLSAKRFSLENITFPHSLKKLHLYGCKIPWEDMTIIGSSLPNLEVLALYHNAFKGPEWNPVEGQFLRLKVLCIWHNHHLVRWRAENVHFPNLETLFLRFMSTLEEIPSGIGDIPTLKYIHLVICPDFVVDSAKRILEEQQSYGNESLQLFVDGDQVVVS